MARGVGEASLGTNYSLALEEGKLQLLLWHEGQAVECLAWNGPMGFLPVLLEARALLEEDSRFNLSIST